MAKIRPDWRHREIYCIGRKRRKRRYCPCARDALIRGEPNRGQHRLLPPGASFSFTTEPTTTWSIAREFQNLIERSAQADLAERRADLCSGKRLGEGWAGTQRCV